MSDLAKALDTATVQNAADIEDKVLLRELESRGFVVHKDEPHLDRHIQLDAPKRGKVRISVVSDTHLGHKRQQLTHWRDFYSRAAKEWKPDFGLHVGDVFDGGRMHRDQEFELFKHGAEAQARYGIENIPELRGAKNKLLEQHVLGGNHDGSFWNSAGADVMSRVASERDDITFLGAPTATMHVSGLKIMLMHPDGGPSYARSHRVQKIIEQLPPDEKPHILLLGHWHVATHLPGYRNVEGFAVPCFQGQTAYMRRKGLAPVLGGLLLEAEFSERGLEDLTTKWVRYASAIENDWP